MDCHCILEDLEKCKNLKIGGCTMSHYEEGFTGSTGATLPCYCPKPEILYDKLKHSSLLLEQHKRLQQRQEERKQKLREQLENQKKLLVEELDKLNKEYELVKDLELPKLKEFLLGKKKFLENDLQSTINQISNFQ
jgi:hypothetical protein